MATTLTLGIGVWPWIYIVQVGDSRAYIYTQGSLRQITRDQTLAEDFVDRGLMKPEAREKSPLAHVLVSSIGGDEAAPIVSRVDVSERGCVLLFCSDGLTKHVTDAEISMLGDSFLFRVARAQRAGLSEAAPAGLEEFRRSPVQGVDHSPPTAAGRCLALRLRQRRREAFTGGWPRR